MTTYDEPSPRPALHRVAMVSLHTSPLDQPGTGDAGGMNVYIVELAQRLAAINIEVEIFTRATTGGLPPTVEMAPGVLVRHVDAGPYEGLNKEDLPAQLCAFTHGVMQAWAGQSAALAPAEPAGGLVRRLWDEAQDLLA